VVPNSCTVLNTVLSSRVSRVRVGRVSRVSRVSAMVSVRFSGMFNMVQEFGTAVYRIAQLSPVNLAPKFFSALGGARAPSATLGYAYGNARFGIPKR